jgi:ABC-type Fe3+-hydroxamate transport system substrate-binding protein
LIASSTEIVCALGLESALAGRSHECDFPETVKRLPRLTEPAIDVGGTSADIDRRVRKSARDTLSIYRVDDVLLAALTGRPGFGGLRAVRERRAYLADGNAFFNRPGPRVVETLEELVEMIHPEVPGFGRKGEVYEPLLIGV